MRGSPAMTRLARVLAATLAVAAIFSDFLSPCPPAQQDLYQSYAPPSRIHFRDTNGEIHWRPFVYRIESADLLEGRYLERTDQRYPLVLLCNGYSYRLFGVIPASRHLLGTRIPGVFHPWGTDDLGRDVLARTLAGARSALLVLLFGSVLYFCLGVGIGAVAGISRGWLDTVLMRFSELVLALPALYVVLAVRALLPQQMTFWQSALLTASIIASVTWPPMARGVRGLILQIQNAAYVEAARALGSTRMRIFRRHMLPALAPFAAAQTAVAAPVFILGEVILSFLNVGFQDSGASWGSMMRNLWSDPRVLTDFWWNLSPLGLVFLTLLCLNTVSPRARPNQPAQLT